MHDAELKRHLDHLAILGAPDLRAEWSRVHGRPAPRRISRDLLLRGIAYRLQEQMYGGLKPATIRKLRKIAAAMKAGADIPAPTVPALKPGVRLLREWNGETRRWLWSWQDLLEPTSNWCDCPDHKLRSLPRGCQGARE